MTCDCGTQLSVIPRLSGMTVQCPACAAELPVPITEERRIIVEEPAPAQKSIPLPAAPTVELPQQPSPELQPLFRTLQQWIDEHDVSPTLSQLRQLLDVDLDELLQQLQQLVQEGFVEHDRSQARGLRILDADERAAMAFALTAPLDPFAAPASPPAGGSSAAPAASPSTQSEPTVSGASPVPIQKPAPVARTRHALTVQLLASEMLQQQLQRNQVRDAHREQLAILLDVLFHNGGRGDRAGICRDVQIPELRYNGFIAMMQRILNVESTSVLEQRDSGRFLQLHLPLLKRLFQLTDQT